MHYGPHKPQSPTGLSLSLSRRRDITATARLYKRKFIWLRSCVYCGDTAEEWDHVLPVSVAATLDLKNRFVLESIARGLYLVPCCGECNRLAGDRPFYDVLSKRKFVQDELRRRHHKLIKAPNWTEDELDDVSPAMRKQVMASMFAKLGMLQRINWPHHRRLMRRNEEMVASKYLTTS